MLNHKHRFYTTIDETVECFECDFKITKAQLWELLELGLVSVQQIAHLTIFLCGLALSLLFNIILLIVMAVGASPNR